MLSLFFLFGGAGGSRVSLQGFIGYFVAILEGLQAS